MMGWGSHPDTLSMFSARREGWFHSYIIQAFQNRYVTPVKPETLDFEKSDRYYRAYATDDGYKMIHEESKHQQRKDDYISALRGDQP